MAVKEVTVAGVRFEHPVMNGAGVCKQLDGKLGLRDLVTSAAAAVVVGSITAISRAGNSGDVYEAGAEYTLNTLGLPNMGIECLYRDELGEMRRLANEAGKPLIVSVAGFSPEQTAYLIGMVVSEVDLIEINFGCPNVWGADGQKRIASFDPGVMRQTLDRYSKWFNEWAPPIGVKLSPFSDPFLLKEVADIIAKSGVVRFVTTSNTFPNALDYYVDGKPLINATDPAGNPVRFAGMSGPALHPIALGQVAQLREALPPEIDIIGVGGVGSADSVKDFLRAGATAVQVVSQLLIEGPRLFERILAGLADDAD